MNNILINTLKGFTDFLEKNKPDLVIVHGDRVEPLACAMASVLRNVKIAHVEGGEVSGTVDEILRHAISKLSHIHFVSNKIAKNRLLQMGENKNNILSFFGILIFISFLLSFITSSAISILLFDESSKAFNIFSGSLAMRLGFIALSKPL